MFLSDTPSSGGVIDHKSMSLLIRSISVVVLYQHIMLGGGNASEEKILTSGLNCDLIGGRLQLWPCMRSFAPSHI